MPRSKDENSLSRRRFLGGLAAAAAAPPLIALGQAEAATTKKKAAPAPKTAAKEPGPDFSVAKSTEEHAALERQWKQTVETVESLRKVAVPVGAEFATGALAPLKLRRGEA
jgi:hypothetical protein